MRTAVLCSLLLAASAALAQDGGTREREGELIAATLGRSLGAEVRIEREGAPVAVDRGQPVLPGDRIKARAPLEVELGGGKVVLDKKAALRFAPTPDVDVVLEVGTALITSPKDSPLTVRAGESSLEVDGKAELRLSGKGELELRVHLGVVALAVRGDERQLKANERVKVSRRGKIGKVARWTPKQLAFLTALLRAGLGPTLFSETFDAPNALRRYPKHHGALKAGGIAVGEDLGPVVEVVFGRKRKERKGLFTYEAGSRLLVQYYLSGCERMTLELWNGTQKRRFVHSVERPTLGRWGEVEIDLDEMRWDQGKERLQPGDTILQVGVSAVSGATLELTHFAVHGPKR